MFAGSSWGLRVFDFRRDLGPKRSFHLQEGPRNKEQNDGRNLSHVQAAVVSIRRRFCISPKEDSIFIDELNDQQKLVEKLSLLLERRYIYMTETNNFCRANTLEQSKYLFLNIL